MRASALWCSLAGGGGEEGRLARPNAREKDERPEEASPEEASRGRGAREVRARSHEFANLRLHIRMAQIQAGI